MRADVPDTMAVVVIGRDEGERLATCLDSVIGRAAIVVYVDSGSSDGSAEMARSRGVEVVELDPSRPFSAARGRNEGYARARELDPAITAVQFVDGDCELAPDWLAGAREHLETRGDVAIVCGCLREAKPWASFYNRLCDIEWRGPVGPIESCGGIFAVRCRAFDAVGGFRETVQAGEEPELCLRIREAGWRIERIDRPMALHDADMRCLGQWWWRVFRGGRGGYNVWRLTGARESSPFHHAVRSARRWTLGWVGLTALACGIAGALGGRGWMLGSLACAIALPLAQSARLAARARAMGMGWATAAGYGIVTVAGKWVELLGHIAAWSKWRGATAPRAAGADVGTIPAPDDAGYAWRSDKARYPRRPWLKEPSIWAVAVHRFGQWNDARHRGSGRRVLERVYYVLFHLTELITGVSLPKSARIGPGMRIWHFGNVFVHPAAVIGANCTLRQGVTIGNRHADGPVPVLEDDVELGAYAQVLGGIRIGKGAKVGAMAVVLQDVPAGAVAVGNPARILPPKGAFPAVLKRDDDPSRDTIFEGERQAGAPARERETDTAGAPEGDYGSVKEGDLVQRS